MSFFSVFGGEGKTDKDSSLVDKLKAIGGSSDRSASGVNITAAAERLKVNPRTVRGWLNEGKNPGPKSGKRVTTLARNAERSKIGRKGAVERARAKGSFDGFSSVHISGEQGPLASGKDYARQRTIKFNVDEAEMERLQNAYIEGGDAAVDLEIQGMAGTKYLPGWGVSMYGDGDDDPGLEWH